MEGLPPGTIFGNRAGIYFDFNDPIFTNTALTTIGENFLTVDLKEVFAPGLSLDAFPNPFTDFLNITFEGLSGKTMQFMIFSMDGRMVWQNEQPFSPVATIYPGDLPDGQYALQVWIDQKLAAAGTIINH
ncbi:MAG: T9SS type A sorting domain-containing protein [Phaeodactylibacter sp.]|nr:T9SS type A sorting domain-containing protein [Phaeodactylibacter sp.]